MRENIGVSRCGGQKAARERRVEQTSPARWPRVSAPPARNPCGGWESTPSIASQSASRAAFRWGEAVASQQLHCQVAKTRSAAARSMPSPLRTQRAHLAAQLAPNARSAPASHVSRRRVQPAGPICDSVRSASQGPWPCASASGCGTPTRRTASAVNAGGECGLVRGMGTPPRGHGPPHDRVPTERGQVTPAA